MRTRESIPTRLWSIGQAIACAAGLFAAGAASATTYNVVAGQNLAQFIENAVDGDLILVGPGTYVAQATSYVGAPPFNFRIRSAITVRSTNGAASTTLQGGAGVDYTVRFHPMTYGLPSVAHNPSGATLEGFTLTGGKGGVEVFDYASLTTLSNITLKSLIVNPDVTPTNTSHGISFSRVASSRIDGCTVVNAYNNGIYIYLGSNNFVTSSTVQNVVTQHAIALSNTTGAVVAGNSVTGSAFHAIIALATTNSRIERNTLSGFKYDGVTITNDSASPFTPSSSNFIGHNHIVSNGWAGGVVQDGTGIFLNGDANGNLIFANDTRGSPENGMALFASSHNVIQANRVHGNYQGGILVWNNTSLSNGIGGTPTNNRVRNNFIYYNPNNAMVNLRSTASTDIGFNFLSALNFSGDPANPTGTPISNAPFTPSFGGLTNQTGTGTAFYGNTVSSVGTGEYFYADTVNGRVSRNRHFGTMNKYSLAGASITWHNGSLMGGNFWSDFTTTGNPSSGTPYNKFIYDLIGNMGGVYSDDYPFASETLGQPYSVTVNLPRSSSAVAAGSTKTIQWDSKGCVLVDIDLLNGGGTAVLAIAASYPDVGYFAWDVPSGQAAGAYSVRVTCKNSAGTSVGVAGTGGAFTVAASGLTLLSPGPFSKATATGTMVVSWARGAAVTGAVNVYISVDGGVETTAASGVTGNYVSVSVPGTASNRVAVRILTGTYQDSTDGYFSIVGGTASTTGISASQNFPYASKLKLEWKSITNARYVDIELFDGALYQPIATSVPDFGQFEWLVEAAYLGNSRNFRLTFRATPGGASLAVVTSPSFNIVAGTDLSITQSSASPSPANVGKDVTFAFTVTNGGPGAATGVTVTDTLPAGSAFAWASPGCTNSAGTVTCSIGSLANGATSAQYNVIVRPGSAGTATNTASVTGGQTDPSVTNNSSSALVTVNSTPAGVPVLRYRLYGPVTLEHHFTTDLNEYNVLGSYVGTWVQEGTAGKVLNNPGSFNGVTAVPYYRLYDTSTRWHHWTTDANEYYTLIQFPWWNAEGVDGYILPTTTTGATQLYRLLYPFIPGLHHWTIDPTEYSILISTYGWIGEGGSGFVVQ